MKKICVTLIALVLAFPVFSQPVQKIPFAPIQGINNAKPVLNIYENSDLTSVSYLNGNPIPKKYISINRKDTGVTYNVTFHFPVMSLSRFHITSPDFYYIETFPEYLVLQLSPGIYDYTFTDDVEKVFLFGRLNVTGDIDTTLSVSSACHEVKFKIRDENGEYVDEGFYNSGDGFGLVIKFPEKDYLEAFLITFHQGELETIHMSDIPEGFEFQTGRHKILKTSGNHYKSYSATFPVIRSMPTDSLFESVPADHLFPYIIKPIPETSTHYYYAFTFFPIRNTLLSGPLDINGLYSFGMSRDLPSNPMDTVFCYNTPTVVDTNYAFFLTGICRQQGSVIILDEPFTFYPPFYINHDNDLVSSVSNRNPSAPVDIIIKAGESAVFGEGAPFQQTWAAHDYGDDVICIFSKYSGQTSELRDPDFKASNYTIKHADTILARDKFTGFLLQDFGFKGDFEIIVTDTNYSIAEENGKLTTYIRFDNSSDDPEPPVIAYFRIVQDEHITTTVTKGIPCYLNAFCGDFNYDTNYYSPLEHVDLYLKNHSEDVWHQAEIELIPELSDSLSAYLYRSEINQFLNDYADSALIDIRIVLWDSIGNNLEEIMSPALLYRNPFNGIGETTSGSYRIYPNPADAIVKIEPSYTGDVTIISSEGKEIKKKAVKGYLNVADLVSGLYLIKLDPDGNDSSGLKFIKR